MGQWGAGEASDDFSGQEAYKERVGVGYLATCFGVLMLVVYLRYHAFVPVDNLPLGLLPCVMVGTETRLGR